MSRYWVYDRKVSDLTTFSATNPRYWIVDSTTNLPVDEVSTKSTAVALAKDYNNGAYSAQPEGDTL